MCYNHKVATYGLELGEKMRKKSENFCNFAAISGAQRLGTMVKSTAGRDCGRFFIVVGEIEEKYILLADGDLRPFETPKKKKLKHCSGAYAVSEELRERLARGEKLQNAELRRTIKKLLSECSE